MLVRVGYIPNRSRFIIMKTYVEFCVPPPGTPEYRAIHLAASSRSPVKRWSDVLVGNRELTSLVDFLPKVAPPRVELLAF